MQVWNVLHATCWKCRMGHRYLRIIARLCRAISSQLRYISTVGKKPLNSNISSIRLHNMANFGALTTELGSGDWGKGFASCLLYCSDVAHRRPTKLCTMFGRLLDWYTIYTFSGALGPWRNLVRAKFTMSKSCVRLYWQRYCTAL